MDNYDLIPIASLKDFIFIVEKYQRGYKWGIKEVEELLFDIETFDNKLQAFYCLQPIVVKETGSSQYELIDGQQRLTTAFIILRFLGINLFKLKYRTRGLKSEDFLNKITDFPILNLEASKKKAINNAWNEIAQNSENDNIDNYHFYTAYQVISNWIQHFNEEKKAIFSAKLLNYTKVIWYKIVNNKTPEKTFIDFNQGKIHLEQAELIKALFVLHLNTEINPEIKAFKINQFAEEWNEIETQLQDDKFWFFVSNDTSDKRKANRIDLLFDIVCEKSKKEESALYSYHKYLNKLNSNKLSLKDWSEIKKLFNLLFEWYNNRKIYHLLGLVIYLRIKNISEIFKEHNNLNQNKDDFEKSLKTLLRNMLNFNHTESKYYLPSLSYQTSKETITILLIFNVATYNTGDFNFRFPFDKFKTQSWSLEHIHAQKAEEFEYIFELKEWIEDIRILLNSFEIENKQELNNKLGDFSKSIELLKENDLISRDIKRELKTLSDLIDKILDKDSIKNICLLDGPTNSSIGNKNFRKKRKEILQIDKKGEVKNIETGKINKTFIPICTKNVFLKYYTKESEEIQFTFWGNTDRNDYLDALEEVIDTYLI